MDLVSFVPGIGPTATFSPGANTSSPLNVAHTGLTNGTSPSTATKNQAEVYNRLLLQVASVIVKSGLTVDNANWAQLGDAVAKLAHDTPIGTYLTLTQYASDFGRSIGGTTGYFKIAGEVIVQYMRGTSTAGVAVPYPIAFPNQVSIVMATGINDNNPISVAPPGISSVNIYADAGGTLYQLLAIGK